MTATTRDALLDQLIAHEGLRLLPYTDTVGKVTIGVGRNLTDKGISRAEALLLLDSDLDECVADLATFDWFLKLDAIRQRVMLDLRFNLGPRGFRAFKKTLASVAQGDYVKASEQMLQSKWAGQVKTRAKTLARMLATGLALLVMLATSASAQTATVLFDAQSGTTAATANSWTSVLYVNGVAFPMVHTCTGTTLVTCQSPLPNITAALTPLGTQTFEVTFKDVILGESPRSAPFARIRPAAPSNLRIQ